MSTEAAWENATPEQRRAGYDLHNAFAAELDKRGHKVVGGAELTPPGGPARCARTRGPRRVRRSLRRTRQQMTGFYLVESDDLDDLTEVCGLLAVPGLGGGIEIRRTVDHGAA